jgi:hypothetical protein
MPPSPPKPSTPRESTEAVNVYRTNACCPDDACGGAMLPDGYSVPLTGPLGPDSAGRRLHRHACSVCRAAGWYLAVYPRLHYVAASVPIDEQVRRLADERKGTS